MDRVLAVLFAAWALLGVVPVGSWTGVRNLAYYADAWALWGRSLAVAVLATLLVMVLGGVRPAQALRRTAAAVAAVPLPRFLMALGVLAALESVAVTVWAFDRMPPIIDAWVQYFQARVLLAGAWVAPAPDSPAHFATLFAPITERGWFGHFPPIHPALLALGLAAGVPWLVTPLLAAFLPAAVYALGAAGGDRRAARLAAGLVLLSPFVIAIDASAMNHVTAALLVALGLAALPGVAGGRVGAGATLGAAVGLGLGIRPLDAGILAIVGGAAALTGLATRRGFGAVVAGALAGVAALVPTLVYNHATTGSVLTFTYTAVSGSLIGIDLDVPWGQTLTVGRALGLTAVDAHQMNLYLLEWPVPVTILAAIGSWVGGRRTRAAASYVLLLVAALFFYFHRDTLFGPRLLFSAVPPLLVLIATGIVGLADVRTPLRRLPAAVGDVAVVALAIVALLAAATLAPLRLASHRTAGSAVGLHPEEDARRAGIARALVLIPDGLGSRIIVRLWAAGVPMARSTRLYNRADACRLIDALATEAPGPDVEARLTAALADASPGRRALGTTPDPMLRFPVDGRPSPRCSAEITRDRRGTLQFAPYLYLNAPALDGPIVWARELGDEDDAVLARRYPDRPVYRYRGPQRDGASPFVLLADRGDSWAALREGGAIPLVN